MRGRQAIARSAADEDVAGLTTSSRNESGRQIGLLQGCVCSESLFKITIVLADHTWPVAWAQEEGSYRVPLSRGLVSVLSGGAGGDGPHLSIKRPELLLHHDGSLSDFYYMQNLSAHPTHSGEL